MKNKSVTLEWYCLIYNWNSRKLEPINILNDRLKENIIKTIKSKSKNKYLSITNLRELEIFLDREFRYYYSARREAEFVVGDLNSRDTSQLIKVDVYQQIEPNLKVITEYVNNKLQLNLN